MKFNDNRTILILLFVFIVLSSLYSEISIAAVYRVNSTSTDYTDLESCLKAINNSEQNTCKIDEPGVYVINKSYYNITGIVESNLNEDYGIVYASVSNITVDFNGTIFVPYNGTESTGQTVFFSRASTNSIGDQSFSIINISFKNINTTASNGFGYAGYFGKKGGTGFYQGINFLNIYNVNGIVFILASNNTLVVNHTGNVTSYTGSDCIDQVNVFNQWTINFTIINSTGDLLSLCRPKFGAISIINYIGKEVIMELAGNNGGFISNVILSGQLAHGATNISIHNASATYTHVGQGNYFNNVTITSISSGCLGISVKLLALNALIENSKFYCNGSTDGVILPLISNITIINSWFNNSDSSSNCITLNGDNIYLYNNTFENCGELSYTSNEAWTLNQSWYASNSSFAYGGTNYNDCVILIEGGAGHEHITSDNMPMIDSDGTINYALWLLTDGLNAVGCGVGAKVTVYAASDYPLACDGLPGATGGLITCDYNESWLFIAEGDGLSYGRNYTNISLTGATLISGHSSPTLNYVNTTYYVNNSAFYQNYYTLKGVGNNVNITGNNFYDEYNNSMYSVNITSPNAYLWYNNFYSGVYAPTATGCYNNKGNFYDYKLNYSNMVRGECGLVNITSPPASAGSIGVKTIQWTAQTSYETVTYILEYILNNVRTRLTTTTSTSYTWSPPATGNYIINVIPFNANYNATHRNISIQIGELEQPSTGSGGSSGGAIVSKDNTRSLEGSSASFAISENELSFDLTQSEEKISSFTLTNSQKESDIIKIELSDSLKGLIKLDASTIILKSGETKKISFTLLPTERTGKIEGIIIINGLNYGYRMPIIITISPKEVVAEATPEEVVLKGISPRLIKYKYIIVSVIGVVLFLTGIVFFKKKKYFY